MLMAVDFSRVEEKHRAIHDRLVNWARWCVGRGGRGMHPMFRGYKSPQHWEAIPPSQPIDSLDAADVEKAVQGLPEPHRFAVRWCYVYGSSPRKACQQAGVSKEGLALLIRDGRQMLVNRAA